MLQERRIIQLVKQGKIIGISLFRQRRQSALPHQEKHCFVAFAQLSAEKQHNVHGLQRGACGPEGHGLNAVQVLCQASTVFRRLQAGNMREHAKLACVEGLAKKCNPEAFST